MLILIIAGGPDKGRIYELTDGETIVLGREGDQVKLNDGKVSREHARLWSEGGQWYLKDLGSRHGTYRNHTELGKGQHAKLKDGDYLQVGNTIMVLGRMPVAHAEKLAMLANPISQAPPRRRATLIAGGLSVAAVLGLGGYLAVQLDALRDEAVPRQEIAELQRQLNESRTQQEQLETSLSQTTQAINQHGDAVTIATQRVEGVADAVEDATDPILQQLATAADSANQQQLAMQRLSEMFAEQQDSDNSEQLLAAVTQMQTLLADQPDADRLAQALEQAIDTNAQATGEAVRLALAEHQQSADENTIATAESNQALLNRVIEGLALVPTREQLAEQVRLAVAESRAQDEQFMRLFLAELRTTGQQITTDITAAVDQDAGQAQQLMQQVMAELNRRPTSEQLATDLRTAMQLALDEQDTSADSELPGLMRQVLSELEQRPTSEQLAADLRRLIGEDAQRTELLVARVISELDQQPTAQQIAMQLQAADNENAARTAALLESVLERVDEQEQLAEQIGALREQIQSLPGRDNQAVRGVLARLDQQDQNNTQILAQLAELRAALPEDLPEQLDLVLTRLDEQVRTEQITAAIEESIQRVAVAHNEQTQATLASFSERLDALPSAEALAEVTQSQEALGQLLDQSDSRDAIAELRSSLELLAERTSAEPDDRLSQIIEMLQQRERTELMLAELHDAMNNQSEETQALRREVLAAIDTDDQSQTQESLREMLSIVSDRLVTDESVRQAIRDEMRGSVVPNRMAFNDARDVTTNTNPLAQQTDPQQTDTPPQQRLTQLELAYKQSFESGQPVTVGAGIVDPGTGEISRGRLIDPSVARAQGYESWRDWYLADRQAEQMRLQYQALRDRNENNSQNNETITLPPPSAPQSDLPE